MKRLVLSIAACSVLTIALIGCGGGGGGGGGLAPATTPTAKYAGIYAGTFVGLPGHVSKFRLNVKSTGTFSGHTDNDFAARSFSGNISKTGVITTTINELVRGAIPPEGEIYITIFNVSIDDAGAVTGEWKYSDLSNTGTITGNKLDIPVPRFTPADGSGVITDNIAGGRTWLQNTKCAILNPGNTSSTAASAAGLIATTLEDGVCGLNGTGTSTGDWELPTYYDMLSLVEDGYTPTTLGTIGFTSMFADPLYWGEEYAFDVSYEWNVNMSTGDVIKSNTSDGHAWPVLKAP